MPRPAIITSDQHQRYLQRHQRLAPPTAISTHPHGPLDCFYAPTPSRMLLMTSLRPLAALVAAHITFCSMMVICSCQPIQDIDPYISKIKNCLLLFFWVRLKLKMCSSTTSNFLADRSTEQNTVLIISLTAAARHQSEQHKSGPGSTRTCVRSTVTFFDIHPGTSLDTRTPATRPRDSCTVVL